MTIIEKLNREFAKETTDEETYNVVAEFWDMDKDMSQDTLEYANDRAELLEGRMEREHGWML